MSDQPYYDPSDSVDIPDDAEPWENRPDAVRDWPRYDVTRRTTSPFIEVWRVDAAGARMALYIDTDEEAVQLAHALLSEVEIAQTGGY